MRQKCVSLCPQTLLRAEDKEWEVGGFTGVRFSPHCRLFLPLQKVPPLIPPWGLQPVSPSLPLVPAFKERG